MASPIKAGNVVNGKVTGIQPYGAFVSIGENKQGLIHISEITDAYVKDIRDHLQVGDTVTVKILNVDEATGKISLSLKALEKGEKIPDYAKTEGNKGPIENSNDRGFRPLKEKLKEWIEQSRVDRAMKK